MSKKATVKILRGTRDSISANSNNTTIDKGELLLDTTDGYLIASPTDNSIINNSEYIIKAREVVGYSGDNGTLKTETGKGNEYHLKYNSSSGNVDFGSNNLKADIKFKNIDISGSQVRLGNNSEFVGGTTNVAIGNGAMTVSNSIAIGNHSQSNSYGVAIGEDTTEIYCSYAVAIGKDAKVAGSFGRTIKDSVAIGNGATVTGNSSVQLGSGTNSNESTLQFNDKTIANNSHLIGPFNGNIDGTYANISTQVNTPKLINTTTIKGGNDIDGSTNINGVIVSNDSGTTKVTTNEVITSKVSNGQNAVDISNISGNNNSTNINGVTIKNDSGNPELYTKSMQVDSITNNSDSGLAISNLSIETFKDINTINIKGGNGRVYIGKQAGDSYSDNIICIGTNSHTLRNEKNNNAITIGNNSSARFGAHNSIVLGNNSSIKAKEVSHAYPIPPDVYYANNSVAIGNNAKVSVESTASISDAIAIGNNATVTAVNAVQIGRGTNSEASTFKFGNGAFNRTVVDRNGNIHADTAIALNNSSVGPVINKDLAYMFSASDNNYLFINQIPGQIVKGTNSSKGDVYYIAGECSISNSSCFYSNGDNSYSIDLANISTDFPVNISHICGVSLTLRANALHAASNLNSTINYFGPDGTASSLSKLIVVFSNYNNVSSYASSISFNLTGIAKQ